MGKSIAVKYLFLLIYFFASKNLAMQKTDDNDGWEMVVDKVEELACRSDQLCKNISKYKYIIRVYENAGGVFIGILPYSISWMIDGYLPNLLWLKDALYYYVTPATLIMGYVVVRYNFSEAKKSLIEGEELLQKAQQLFAHLGQVCNECREILADDSNEYRLLSVENHLKNLEENKTPVGNFLSSIMQRLQKHKVFNLYSEKNGNNIFCEIFFSLLETVVKNDPEVERNNILHFKGVSILSYDFFDIESLKEHVASNFKPWFPDERRIGKFIYN